MSARERFIHDTLHWLETRLLEGRARVEPDTPLFEGGLIDSLRILSLIAWTEHATGSSIHDRQIRMDNFRTVRRIAEVFVQEV